jgi:hypothetical protein
VRQDRAKGAYPPPIEAHPISSSATAPIAAKALIMSVSAVREISPRVGGRARCSFHKVQLAQDSRKVRRI